MAFQGGTLSTVAITSAVLAQTASQAVDTAFRQVYQGSGKSFVASAGQTVASNAAGSLVNIALNSSLGAKVKGPDGLSLNSGSNLLASQITPFVSGTVAAAINQTIQRSLGSAGPFGPVLSSAAGTVVSQLFGGLGGASASITPATPATGERWGAKAFPGGGGEPRADYGGGSPYTLGPAGGDVMFSLQPANKGPQQSGLDQSINDPAVNTLVPFDHFIKPQFVKENTTADALKIAAMNDNLTKSPFTRASGVVRDVPLF